MSTAQKQFTDGTLASNRMASGFQGLDPRRRRFALNPGIYMAMMEQRESGRQEILLPSGLVSFRTTQLVNPDYDYALKNGHNPSSTPQMVVTDYTALYFLQNALSRYSEHGMRELSALTMLEDPQPNEHGNVTKEAMLNSAQGYFNAFWPSFEEVGLVCPEELKECVTCRLYLLGNPFEGEEAHESIQERVAKLKDQDRAHDLHEQIVESVQGYFNWCRNKWAALLGELADRKTGAPAIAKLGEAEHYVRRQLHAIEPSEAATAAGFGAEVAAGQAEGFEKLAKAFTEGRPVQNDNSELMKLMIERQNKTDDNLAKLTEAVTTLVKNQKTDS